MPKRYFPCPKCKKYIYDHEWSAVVDLNKIGSFEILHIVCPKCSNKIDVLVTGLDVDYSTDEKRIYNLYLKMRKATSNDAWHADKNDGYSYD
jgi:hypothetical protein